MNTGKFGFVSLWVGAAMIVALPAFAADPKPKASPFAPSKEMREKMAVSHQKMAECLKSDRPISECHEEMMRGCEEMHGKGGCPMMGGMGMGMGKMHYGMRDKGKRRMAQPAPEASETK